MRKNNFITELIDQIKNQSNNNVLGSSLAYYIKPKDYETISYGNSRIESTTGEAGNLGGITVIGKRPKYNYLRTHTVHTHPLTFSDALKGIDTATGPLLHFAQPSQYVGAFRDAYEGKNPLISILRGNTGFFDEQYAKEHPWVSTIGNLVGDIGILATPKTLSTIKAINDAQIARSNALSAEALRAASNPSPSHTIGETVRTNVLGEPIVNEAAAWQNGQRAVQQMLYPKGILDDKPLIARALEVNSRNNGLNIPSYSRKALAAGGPPDYMSIRHIQKIAKQKYGKYLDEAELGEILDGIGLTEHNRSLLANISEKDLEVRLNQYFKAEEMEAALEAGQFPKGLTSNEPLIARGSRPYTSPQSSGWRQLQLSEPIMDGGKNIAWPARKGFNPILEEDIPELQKMYNEGKFREMTVHHPRKPSETVKMYFLPNKKQPISEQELEALLEKYNPPLTDEEFNNPFLTVDAKTELGKAKKTYKKIKDKYSGEMEELKNQIEHDYTAPIDWNWYNGGILSESNVPAKVAISPVFDPRYGRIVNPKSIIQRFYDNILNKDGIIQRTQKYLLDKKIIEPWEGKWVYQIPGRDSRVLVDPTRFTLNWILEKELQSTNRVPFSRMLDQIGRTEIPYHSTPIGDRTLYQLFADPSKRPLFTSIDDGSKGFYPLKRAYQKTQYGTSIPVFTKSKLIEGDPLISENGLHSSNNFGDVGELMSHFQRNGGKPQKVIDVSDARNIKGNTGQRQNEYNFGAGTPDIGFLLNTLDLSEPARVVGPFQGYKKGGKFNKH